MHMTLSGKGAKCRICTHPERNQIESLLARGAGISSLKPLMAGTFSRRSLYRHRAKHMIHAVAPAARPVPFPRAGSIHDRLRWLLQEAEHTAALAEARGDLSLKLKAQHEMGRLIWLEARLNRDPRSAIDVTPGTDPLENALSPETRRHLDQVWEQSQRDPDESDRGLQAAFRRSESTYARETGDNRNS